MKMLMKPDRPRQYSRIMGFQTWG